MRTHHRMIFLVLARLIQSCTLSPPEGPKLITHRKHPTQFDPTSPTATILLSPTLIASNNLSGSYDGDDVQRKILEVMDLKGNY